MTNLKQRVAIGILASVGAVGAANACTVDSNGNVIQTPGTTCTTAPKSGTGTGGAGGNGGNGGNGGQGGSGGNSNVHVEGPKIPRVTLGFGVVANFQNPGAQNPSANGAPCTVTVVEESRSNMIYSTAGKVTQTPDYTCEMLGSPNAAVVATGLKAAAAEDAATGAALTAVVNRLNTCGTDASLGALLSNSCDVKRDAALPQQVATTPVNVNVNLSEVANACSKASPATAPRASVRKRAQRKQQSSCPTQLKNARAENEQLKGELKAKGQPPLTFTPSH